MRVTRHPLPEHLAHRLPLGSTAEGSCGGSVPITASLTPRLAPWMEEAFRYGPATARAARTGHLQGSLGAEDPKKLCSALCLDTELASSFFRLM